MDFDEFQGKNPEDEGTGDDFSFGDDAPAEGQGPGDEAGADDFGLEAPEEPEGGAGGMMDFEPGPGGEEYEGGFEKAPLDYGSAGTTGFFGFFKKGLQIALFKGEVAEEVAADPGAFVPALVIFTLPSVVIGVLLFLVVNFFAGAAMSGEGIEGLEGLPVQLDMVLPFLQKASLGIIIFFPLMAVIGSIISVGLLHLFARLLKGDGSFLDYYQTMGVGSLISWGGFIPWIGPLFSLWMLPVMVVVTSRVHNLSTGRSVAVVLLPLVIVVVVLIAVFMAGLSAFMGGMGDMQTM